MGWGISSQQKGRYKNCNDKVSNKAWYKNFKRENKAFICTLVRMRINHVENRSCSNK